MEVVPEIEEGLPRFGSGVERETGPGIGFRFPLPYSFVLRIAKRPLFSKKNVGRKNPLKKTPEKI
jgi:hypothetical protein